MSYQIYTLIDITPTGKHRGRNDGGKEVNQQTNWLTFQNCAMLRTNISFGEVTSFEDIVDKYMFGSDYQGKHKIWSVIIDPDQPDAVNSGMLKDDFDLVPMIDKLDETVQTNCDLFFTKDETKRNILFINTSDNTISN